MRRAEGSLRFVALRSNLIALTAGLAQVHNRKSPRANLGLSAIAAYELAVAGQLLLGHLNQLLGNVTAERTSITGRYISVITI